MMRTFLFAAAAAIIATAAIAQTPTTYAVRPGEAINLGAISWVNSTTCQSLAVSKPDVEILSGPPGLAVEVREMMVVPNNVGNCRNEVRGAQVWLTVPPDIEGTSAHVVTRVTHHDRNGPQQRGFAFNLIIAR